MDYNIIIIQAGSERMNSIKKKCLSVPMDSNIIMLEVSGGKQFKKKKKHYLTIT